MLHICVAIIIIRYNNSFYIEAARTAAEQRSTELQREMFRRYKENRDYEQAQSQYKT